jgi:hypothetical protein
MKALAFLVTAAALCQGAFAMPTVPSKYTSVDNLFQIDRGNTHTVLDTPVRSETAEYDWSNRQKSHDQAAVLMCTHSHFLGLCYTKLTALNICRRYPCHIMALQTRCSVQLLTDGGVDTVPKDMQGKISSIRNLSSNFHKCHWHRYVCYFQSPLQWFNTAIIFVRPLMVLGTHCAEGKSTRSRTTRICTTRIPGWMIRL